MARKQTEKSAQREKDIDGLARWRRARAIVEALIRDPRLSTPLGRMLLLGAPRAISEELFEAGVRGGRVLERYDMLVLGVRRGPAIVSLSGGGGRTLKDDPQNCDVRDATDALMRLEGVLGGVKFFGAKDAAKRLMRGEEMAPEDASRAVEGLKALALHYRLTGLSADQIRHRARRFRYIGEDNLQAALKIAL